MAHMIPYVQTMKEDDPLKRGRNGLQSFLDAR
jgi:hypothetical protein